MAKYFIDCEFLEGAQDKRFLGIKYGKTKPTIDLISIALVGEDGREYYAISKDFNLKEAWNRFDLKLERPEDSRQKKFKEYWIRENVLKPIWIDLFLLYEADFTLLKGKAYDSLKQELKNGEHDKLFTFKSFKALVNRYGKTNKQIAEDIKSIFLPDKVKHTGNYPNTYPKDVEFYGYFADYDWVVFCWLFGNMIDLPKGFPMYCIDLKQEIDSWIKTKGKLEVKSVGFDKAINRLKQHPNYPKQTNEHNASADARWNRELYKFLESL